ncbi:universal stress protein [Vagococcus salmoninarum]|uniref:Universal stress protein n=1 Tax=Vagococcus salmoninarum TaxID=2739 RepID=A0A429ZSP6_9ENTE|nr:universal stress protein [Vagococcus salmoninarum]MBE9388752.1 universal stress protein [Vagococcus salmoninarum]RST96707.1 universal stress protein UspA [Vagococcus salmoninarum]
MIQQYQNILVAVDGSDESEKAFKKAVNVAKRNDANLVLAHIIDTRAFQSISSFDDELANQATTMAKQTLAELTTFAKNLGVEKITQVVKYGAPKTILAKDLPSEYQIDLIMVGATGLNAVERLLIGSVSEYIIRHAHCDVLVVRTDLTSPN